jgi:hypothetical protein
LPDLIRDARHGCFVGVLFTLHRPELWLRGQIEPGIAPASRRRAHMRAQRGGIDCGRSTDVYKA